MDMADVMLMGTGGAGMAGDVEETEWTGRDSLVSEDGHTIHILLAKRAHVEAQIEKIQKRAARKGLTPVTIIWGKAYRPWKMTLKDPLEYEMRDGRRSPVQVRKYLDARVSMTIAGDSPNYGGWRFIAALQHLEGENIVRTLPGETVPEMYRTRGPACDHCKSSRRRNDTYVLAHEDGRLAQVGSTCIDDFLGSADAHKLAFAAMYFAELLGAGEEGFEGSGGDMTRTLDEFLPFVAWCVREQGWTSRTAAREHGGGATADGAFWYMTDEDAARKANVHPSEVDIAEATTALAWAEAITDADIEKERGDFLHNLRAVARTGLVTYRTAGIAGAVIIAYQRAIGRERERKVRATRPELNEFLGTVGKRETWNVTLDFVTGFETAYGYTTLLKFRTNEGATLVWKATGDPKAGIRVDGVWQKKDGVAIINEITRADVGKRYAVKGTVKKHDIYQGKKQTLLSRCDVDEVRSAT